MGLVVAAVVAVAQSAAARRRPLFEPTDLEMEDVGTLEVDLQLGIIRGRDPWRLAVPDFEIDLGVAPGVEIDVDGAYAIEGPDDGGFSFDHPSPDNLWTAAKFGLYDQVDEDTPAGWAVGAQLGPKVPVAQGARGIGYEVLLLVGRHHWIGDNHLVLNLGGFVEPGGGVSSQRPIGLEAGVDASFALRGTPLSLTTELAGVRFFSGDPHQLHGTAGIVWATTSALDISLIGLIEFLRGGDRAGVLLGVSPKFALWH
jgi:hypothetical protein